MPCSEKRARLLLACGLVAVHRRLPFVIRFKDRTVAHSEVQLVRLTLYPESRTTGMALVRETETVDTNAGKACLERAVFNMSELTHCGQLIRKQLDQCRAFRRGGHRYRKIRYRSPCFDNRRHPSGWLAPSLRHRVDTTASWVNRMHRWASVSALGVETARFDTQ